MAAKRSRTGFGVRVLLMPAALFMVLGLLGPAPAPAADAGLVWSTFLGGGTEDWGMSIVLDSSGNAFVTGYTWSSDFPTTASAYGASFSGVYDVFVAKLDPTGSALIYSSLIGGNSEDDARSIVLDSSGNACITGCTSSSDFPTTAGAYDTSHSGGGTWDVFVTKLAATGSTLLYSTFIGGSADDRGTSIALDSSGNACVTGWTSSGDFPTTAGAYDTSHNGYWDVFVTKLNAAGTALVYSTYIGGSIDEIGYSLALDSFGNACLTGCTRSSDFPTTAGAYDTLYNGGYHDVFVTKLNATGTALIYSTFLGGDSDEAAYSLVLDPSANACITGITSTTHFPTTAGAYDTSHNGGWDIFVTKLNATGSALIESTLLGGSSDDVGNSLALDSFGNGCLTGCTFSSDFPMTAGAYDTSFNGGTYDIFVTKLNAAGTALIYSTFIGGTDWDYGYSLALDLLGNAWLTGCTVSSDFPTTADAYDTSHNGSWDVFVLKFAFEAPPIPTVTPTLTATPTLTPVPRGRIQGHVTFRGRSDHEDYVKITLNDGSTGAVMVYRFMTDPYGAFTISDVPAGTYHALCHSPVYLDRLVTPLVVPPDGTVSLDFVLLQGGDLNDDNRINAFDVAGFSAGYGQSGDTMP